jgi:hypothetical protein
MVLLIVVYVYSRRGRRSGLVGEKGGFILWQTGTACRNRQALIAIANKIYLLLTKNSLPY